MEITAKIRKFGRIVIPQSTREFCNIKEGDILKINIVEAKHPDGRIEIFPQEEDVERLRDHGQGD